MSFLCFLNQLFFIRVVFVADFSYQFFDHVLHGDHADGGAVLAQNKSDGTGFFPKFHQKIGYIFIFIGIVGLAQNLFEAEFLLILHQYKIFDIDDADDVIRVFVVNRYSCKHAGLKGGKQLLIGCA